jgi:hypothetical protein
MEDGMTLAFHGKSRKRQQGLLLAAFIAVLFGALAGASAWESKQAEADDPPPITVTHFDGGFQGGQVYWVIRFKNSGPAVTVDVAESYFANGTSTNLAGTNGAVTGCTYTSMTLWEDCEVTLNASDVNLGMTQITFYTTAPQTECAPSPEVSNTVTATLNGVPIPAAPGADTTGHYIHPADSACEDMLGISIGGSLDLIEDGASVEWTVNLENAGPATTTAYVLPEGATLVRSFCDEGNTATQTGAVISCAVPPGNAGYPPEATLQVKSPYNASPLEECKGGTRTFRAHLVDSGAVTVPGEEDPTASMTAKVLPELPGVHCISVTKTNVSETTWQIVFTNSGPEADINFSDTYESPESGWIRDIAVNGVGIACLFDAGGAKAEGCSLTLPSGVEGDTQTIVEVTTDAVLGGCDPMTVTNTVHAYLGSFQTWPIPGSPATAHYIEPVREDCYHHVKLCKMWTLDAPGEVTDGKADFRFSVRDESLGKGDPDTVVTIRDVVEGGGPQCAVVRVVAGLVSFDEEGPGTGFHFDGYTAVLGGTPDLGPIDDDKRPFFVMVGEWCTEPTPGIIGDVLALARDIQRAIEVVTGPEPIDIRCTITYFNHDDADRVATGDLVIETYRDINGDGDADEAALGEGPVLWGITLEGPDPAVEGHYPPIGESRTFEDLAAGASYTVTADAVASWVATNATIDAVSLGAVASAQVEIPNGGATVLRLYHQPLGSIAIRKVAEVVTNGVAEPAPDDDDGWSFTVSSADCEVSETGTTDALGELVFEDLPMCADYVVTESPVNAASPGFAPVGPVSVTGQRPEAQTLTFVNRRPVSPQTCTDCEPSPTATPTEPRATPTTPAAPPAPPVTGTVEPSAPGGDPPAPQQTATPSTPAVPATVTSGPTGRPPVTEVAGVNTRAPGLTPIAPSTGSGGAGSNAGDARGVAAVLGAVLAALGGAATGALARRR